MTTFFVYRDDGKPVTRDSHTRQVWEFWMGTGTDVLLDRYWSEERPSPRHKWRPTTVFYDRLKPRIAYTPDDRRVPLPTDVTIEVLEQVKAMLRVKRWSEVARL